MKQNKALTIQEQDARFEFVQKELFEYWSEKIETNDYTFEHGFGLPGADYASDDAGDLPASLSASDSGFVRLFNACSNGIALIGGAGTGKTHILIHLALFLIRKKLFTPDEMLFITATTGESGKIAAALKEHGNDFAAGIRVKGIGEFALKLLSDAYESAPRVFDAGDRMHFLSLIFPFLNEDNLSRLSGLICDESKPDAGGKTADGDEDFINLRDTYIDSLYSIKACDSRLIAFQAIKVLHEKPNVCFQFRQKYRFIFIDDLQQYNENEINLISFLLKQGNCLDSDHDVEQKIAVSIDPVEQNRAVYKNFLCELLLSDFVSRRFFLKKSYRVPGRILSGIRTLFSKEKTRKKNVPKSMKGQGSHPGIFRAENPCEEADYIAHTIQAKINENNAYQSKPYTWADFGICLRNRIFSAEIRNALDRAKVPFLEDRELPFTGTRPYHQIVSFFRFIISEKDLTAFTDILLYLSHGFTIRDIRNIFISGNRLDESLPQLLLRLYNNRMLSDQQYKEIVNLFEVKNRIKKMVQDSGIARGIEFLLKEYGIQGNGAGIGETDQPVYMNQFMEFAIYCKNDIVRFLSGLFTLPHKISGVVKDAVSVFSFSQAKGRVFPVLFIPCMEEGICPRYHAASDMQTESGMFYTAVTRSSGLVYFSYSAERDNEQRQVSSFILNMKSKVKEINPSSTRHSSPEFDQGNLFFFRD